MRIRSLELRARRVVEGLVGGLHRSPYHGFSVEFTEYREYTPGEDLRYLDWKLLARRDRMYVKRFEDETNLRCWLLFDASRSMEFGSGDYTKADYARTLAATFAYFLSLQRDAVGLATFGETVDEFIPARFRHGHLRRVMVALERTAGGNRTDCSAPLAHVAERVRKRGVVVLISDLLAPPEQLHDGLARLSARGHELLVVQVLDPTEVAFDFDRPARFEYVESGRQLYVDPDAVRRDYLARFERHQTEVAEACRTHGAEHHLLTIDEPLDLALHELLSRRMNTTRPLTRRAA